MIFADYFDGVRALARRAEVTLDDSALRIDLPGTPPVAWPLGDLRSVPDQAGKDSVVVTSCRTPLARLYIDDSGLAARLRAAAPNLKRRPPVRGARRIIGWAAAAVASVALIIFVLVPRLADQLAQYLPPDGEKALGDATLEQIRNALDQTGLEGVPFCDRPDGLAALDRMQARLADGVALPYPLTVSVLDHPMINAFALPGGHIVFFRGLIEAAEAPDEVAAVFAHELGHVAARDPARIALRSAGSIGVLGLLLGDFAGGAAVLFLAERLIRADYTQAAEAAADSFAHARLRAVGLPPHALADMFERLREEYGETPGIVSHFAAHPSLGDRIAAARSAGRGQGDTSPALTGRQWAALRGICD